MKNNWVWYVVWLTTLLTGVGAMLRLAYAEFEDTPFQHHPNIAIGFFVAMMACLLWGKVKQ